jgi:hypothetical protein
MLCIWFGWSSCTSTSNMAEAKMRTPSRSLAAFAALLLVAFATLLMEGSVAAYAAGADAAPGDTSPPKPPKPPKPSECQYRDAKYGEGAMICVAPGFAQICDDKSKWSDPTQAAPYHEVCAHAQISVPGTPTVQCLYHDVKYVPGAKICVGPKYGLLCSPDGVWTTDLDASFEDACAKAQIPAPTYPAAPAGK